MYKLMVSRNCGMTYTVAAEAVTVEGLMPKAGEFTEQMLRWAIEDEVGNLVKATPIFEAIFDWFGKLEK